jgi:hypothetical protein
MNDNEPFETHALRAAIDCHWSNWARKKFIFQACVYWVNLLCFTIFCEFYRNESRSMLSYVIASMVFIEFFFFTYREFKQYMAFGVSYFRDGWNLIQWINKFFTLSSVILGLAYNDDATFAVISSTAVLLGWVSSFFYLRGIEDCAWIVTALLHLATSMIYFMLVLLIVLIGFAFFFRNLQNKVTLNEPIFSGTFSSLITAFDLGVVGSFDTDTFQDGKTHKPEFAIVMNVVLFLVVTVISLNALIAFLSAAFEEVLVQKLAVLKKQKASIILDLYSVLSEEKRREIEEKNKWTTMVVPTERLELDAESKAVNEAKASKLDLLQLKESLVEDLKAIKKDNDNFKEEMGHMKNDVKAILALIQDLKRE